jgi:hypothetical protein
MLAELDRAGTEPAAEYRWVEWDRAIYVRHWETGRCVAFARRRVADKRWEVKLAGSGHLVYVVEHRGKARGKLRRLVAGIGAGS